MKMTRITVDLPASVAPFARDLEFFLQVMVRKLHTNRHKGFAEGADVSSLLDGLDNERGELGLALLTLGQFESAVEAADVANMAFLVFSRLMAMDKVQYTKERDAL